MHLGHCATHLGHLATHQVTCARLGHHKALIDTTKHVQADAESGAELLKS